MSSPLMRRFATHRPAVLFAVAFIALAIAGPAFGQESSAAITTLQPVTQGDFTKLYPSIDPNGEKLLYQARDGNDPFYVYMIDLRTKSSPRRLTIEDFASENPRWAGKDGKVIVYDSDRIPKTRMVWRQELEGVGGLSQISLGGTLDFQPDIDVTGEKAVYCSKDRAKLKSPKDGEDRIYLFKEADDLPDIKLLNLKTAAMSTLAKGVNPVFDPKGERIAFASNITGNYEIYIVNIDGTSPEQVTSFEGPDVEPAWSPDGRYLAFARLQNKNWNVWMVEIATGKQTQLTIHEDFDGGPAWAKDGTIYFHSDRSGEWDIWSMQPAGYKPLIEPEPASQKDTDGDGYADDVDLCVSDAEDMDGFEDEDGCPDLDNDADGVADTTDRCPKDPETMNLYKDTDGCPDETPVKKKMVLFGVLFKSGKADLSPDSIPFLDAFADLMQEDAAARVEIRGYTDDVGSDAVNLKLSQQRAESVRQYLMLKGISGDRMKALGYGEADPICTERTNECRTRNRRIEVHRLN